MMQRKIFVAAGFATLSLLIGCVPNKIYRPGTAAVQTAPVLDGVPGPAHFKLGIVEFDDMGESWEKCTSLSDPDNCQLTRTLALIQSEKQRAGSVVVVVFIHGWKNNASPDNEAKKNLHDFKIFMESLSTSQQAAAARKIASGIQVSQPAYVGVYMAWRGQSLANDVFLTFWNRRDTAQRVGSSDFAEALYRIMGTTKESKDPSRTDNSRIVVVGHSFGGRVLETALTNTFVSLLVPQVNPNGKPGPPEINSPADLILYVNPATDSFRTKQMIELMKRTNFSIERGSETYHGPLFLSVTSTGDTATGTAFPLGQDLSATQKAFRQGYDNAPPNIPSQETFFTKTPGHIPYLFSHVVHQVTDKCISQSETLRFTTKGACFEMTPVPQRWNDSPFWVTTVPPAIIKDHTDIFNTSFSTMIIRLMEYFQVLDSPSPATMVRSH